MKWHLLNSASLGAIGLAMALLSPVTALAQSATAASAAPEVGQLEEVVVTAEKRSTTEQKTAIAMSVIDATTLKSNGVGNLKDLTNVAPSVSFAQQNASVIVGIRGVSSRDVTNPAVSLSMDGFYTQQPTGLNASIFDLERVEVLRGPQGTLLGRNATGGSVDIITAKPAMDFAAYLTGETGNYGTLNSTGMINVPVSDKLQLRAAFQTRDHDGYRKNPAGSDGDDEHSKAARLHIAFQPTERLSGLVTLEYSKIDDVGPVVQGVAQRYTASGAIDLSRPSIPNDGRSFSVPAGGYENGETKGVRWNATYDLGVAQLTYLGGFRRLDYERLNTLGALYGSARQNLSYNSHDKTDTWNHEVRLTSKGDSHLFWQVGGFYFHEKNNGYTTFQDYRNSATLLEAPTNIFIYDYPNDVAKAKAVFGQVAYNLTDTLKIEGGVRYTKDNRSREGYATLASLGAYLATGALNYTTTPQNVEASSSKVTYHGGLNWQLTPSNLLYGKIDTGYKAGGFNELTTYDPETITAYEVGSKNRFFDNRFQLNVDAFYYAYKNQQVTQFLPSSANSTIVNAGESEYYGVEAEGVAMLTPVDRFNLYAAYIHAEYKDFAVANGASNLQLAGNIPPQAPRWTFNAGYQHDFDVFGGVLTARAQTHYESKTYFTVYNYEADSQPAYFRSDATITYKPDGGKWQLEGYVRNIENTLVLSNAQNPASSTYLAYRYQYQAPRTMGVKLTVNW